MMLITKWASQNVRGAAICASSPIHLGITHISIISLCLELLRGLGEKEQANSSDSFFDLSTVEHERAFAFRSILRKATTLQDGRARSFDNGRNEGQRMVSFA